MRIDAISAHDTTDNHLTLELSLSQWRGVAFVGFQGGKFVLLKGERLSDQHPSLINSGWTNKPIP
jgi:hypothetical protein